MTTNQKTILRWLGDLLWRDRASERAQGEGTEGPAAGAGGGLVVGLAVGDALPPRSDADVALWAGSETEALAMLEALARLGTVARLEVVLDAEGSVLTARRVSRAARGLRRYGIEVVTHAPESGGAGSTAGGE